jgi:hypothetical protein
MPDLTTACSCGGREGGVARPPGGEQLAQQRAVVVGQRDRPGQRRVADGYAREAGHLVDERPHHRAGLAARPLVGQRRGQLAEEHRRTGRLGAHHVDRPEQLGAVVGHEEAVAVVQSAFGRGIGEVAGEAAVELGKQVPAHGVGLATLLQQHREHPGRVGDLPREVHRQDPHDPTARSRLPLRGIRLGTSRDIRQGVERTNSRSRPDRHPPSPAHRSNGQTETVAE